MGVNSSLDSLLFEETVKSEFCHYQPGLVKSITYDPKTDRVSQLQLDQDLEIETDYVFDCSNQVGILPKAMQLPVKTLGKKQKVAFTHLGTTKPVNCQESWLHSTNLMITKKSLDGVNGFCWCIPLGQHVSIGISCDSEEAQNISPEEMIELLIRAFTRNGINLTTIYDQKYNIASIQNQYYLYEKISGANWLLAGPTAGQIWFPSGSAVGLCLFAACLADKFLANDPKALELYQTYFDSLLETHEIFNKLRYQDMEDEYLNQLTNNIFIKNGERLCFYALGQSKSIHRSAARYMQNKIAAFVQGRNFCPVEPI